MIQNSRVLVTGGAGFIGSHIATKLALAQGNEIIIYDNFSTGRKENITHLMDKTNIKVVQGDIRDKNELDEQMVGIDYVFHLAALISVPLSIDEPKKTKEINKTGTLNILEAARKFFVKKVVFSSSAAVYGDDPTLPKVESIPTLPKSPYAETKIAGENYCIKFYHDYGLGATALRYFNVFGPH